MFIEPEYSRYHYRRGMRMYDPRYIDPGKLQAMGYGPQPHYAPEYIPGGAQQPGPATTEQPANGATGPGIDFTNLPAWAWVAAGAVLYFMFGKNR